MFITYSMILTNIIFYIISQKFQYFYLIGGLNLSFFSGYYFQLLSNFFLHGSIIHLLFNMLIFYSIGKDLEPKLGSVKFLLIYLISGILISLISLLYIYINFYYFGNFINLIGASAVICFLLSSFIFANKNFWIAALVISISPLALESNAAWWAHLIGFGLGNLYFKFLDKRF